MNFWNCNNNKDDFFDSMICVERKREKRRERPLSLYERTRNQVYATGNKWAIENFHATHD